VSLKLEYFPAVGGLNQEAPPLSLGPGELVDVANYECLANGGYRRIFGYTLFDGQSTATQSVPGSGVVKGVHIYQGNVYAIREDGTNARMYKATSSGWVEVNNAKTWSLNGTFRFANYNFQGQDAQERMYIVNGVDQATEFNGTVFSLISTGASSDNPSSVVGYKKHLVLGIQSSLHISEIGNPSGYTVGGGAAEIAVGDTITNLKEHASALIVGCEDSSKTLYGSSAADWQLDELNKAGTYPGTMQSIAGQVVGLDRQGLMSLAAAQQYGNFAYASLSGKVKTLIKEFSSSSVSVLNRANGQYRLFNGQDGLYFSFNGPDLIGVTKTRFPQQVMCAASAIDETETEISVFGANDGNVYKMDTGFRFGTSNIYSFILTNFTAYQGPTIRKRYRLVQPDIRVQGSPIQVVVRATTEYGLGEQSAGQSPILYTSPGSLWDISEWNEFSWGSAYSNDAKIRVSVTGANMGVYIGTDGSENASHTIHGVTLHYSPRRLIR
tara:strand:- start:225 stop:1712 length:1488 start_codon:yes stop_codon:yes gene_type:complete